MKLTRRIFEICRQQLLRISRSRQIHSQLRDLALWDLDTNQHAHLAVQGLDTVELVDHFGSPLLVVNNTCLMRDVNELKRAWKVSPSGSRILYSYKTNCIPGILRLLHEEGLGAEVISPYELWLAEQLGVPGDQILYNGVDKSDESLQRAIRLGVLSINVDYLDEVDKIAAVADRLNMPANVGVRLALSSGSQFGLDIASGEAMAACQAIKARADWLRFECIHVHLTSNENTSGSHNAYAVKALEFARHVRDNTGLTAQYLDLGGGFGVPTTKNMTGAEYGLYRLFGALPEPPRLGDAQPIGEFIGDIVNTVQRACDRLGLDVPRLLIEPGRLVTSRAEFLLSRVRAIKRRKSGPVFAITDTGRLSLTFPCEFEYHEVFVADRPQAPMDACYEVKGRICTSADWMFKNRCLPELKPGDVLAVMDAGAYFSSNASNFAFPRPAIVLVEDGLARVIRREETFEHLIAMDVR